MSLTLQESCNLYERHARRNKTVQSFAEFNKQHFTCLPVNADVERDFVSAVNHLHMFALKSPTNLIP